MAQILELVPLYSLSADVPQAVLPVTRMHWSDVPSSSPSAAVGNRYAYAVISKRCILLSASSVHYNMVTVTTNTRHASYVMTTSAYLDYNNASMRKR